MKYLILLAVVLVSCKKKTLCECWLPDGRNVLHEEWKYNPRQVSSDFAEKMEYKCYNTSKETLSEQYQKDVTCEFSLR